MKFTELNLDKNIIKGIEKAGFTDLTPVQEATFNFTLKGKDVSVQSQTGTGKTAAFLVSIFHISLSNKNNKKTKAIIIVPTRELAVQIEKEAKLIGSFLNLSIGSFYGGVGYHEQEKNLKKGLDIIIGTPGRLIDFAEQRILKLNDLNILIIDEADRLFDMGFYPDIQKIIKGMPSKSERMTMLFSATLNTRIRNLAWQYMNEPEEIAINPENVTVENITQKLYHVGKEDKMSLLIGILKTEKPDNAIIFTNMKRTAFEVAKRLDMNGLKCQYIIGDLPQSQRLKIINDVKSGKVHLLVATDVAARGLHINDLKYVINYDLPDDCENYVHRIGRTARAGKSGQAVSLACEKYVYNLAAIESFTKYKIPIEWPESNLFAEDQSKGVHFNLDVKGVKRNSRDLSNIRPHKGKSPSHIKRSDGVSPNAQPHQKLNAKRYDGRKSSLLKERQLKNGKDIMPSISDHSPLDKINKSKNVLPDAGFKNLKPAKKEKGSNNRNLFKRMIIKRFGTLDDRMELYKKKYGPNFVPSSDLLAKETKKGEHPMLAKLLRFLNK